MTVLEMKHITQQFGQNYALNNVDFKARSGEIHALLGENGAGKSTLMKVLAGLHPNADGEVRLDGERLTLSSPAEALELGIGVVHQEFDLVPQLTVAENVYLGREIKRRVLGAPYLSKSLLREQCDELIKQHGIDGFLKSADRVHDLPVGAKQLVQILKVLVVQPRVMVFDEPSARLSSSERDRLFTIVEKLREAGTIIVYVSHHLEEVFRLAQHITILRNGQVVHSSTPADLDVPRLSELMLGKAARAADKVEPPTRDHPSTAGALTVTDLFVGARVRGVNFTVGAGRVLGLTGVLGSGRQELTRALTGQIKSTGSVQLTDSQGVAASRLRLGREIGLVPEDRRREGLCLDRSVLDNMALGFLSDSRTRGMVDRRKATKQAARLQDQVHLKCDSLEQPVWQLSGGNQQKVLLARWLGSQAKLIVLESPTVGVDVGAKEEIHGLIRLLSEQGRTVIVSSDDTHELESLCDRVLLLEDGTVSRSWDRGEFTHKQLVGALMGRKAAAVAADLEAD